LHLSALSHWVIYLDFLGAAMGKRVLIFFVFCLGVWLSACQAGPIQTISSSQIIPQAGPLQQPIKENKNIKTPLTRVNQKDNKLLWYDSDGQLEAVFSMSSVKPSLDSKHIFKTQFMDFVNGDWARTADNYSTSLTSLFVRNIFRSSYQNPSTGQWENPLVDVHFPESNHYDLNPYCKPTWEIYLDNKLMGAVFYEKNKTVKIFTDPRNYNNSILKIVRKPMLCAFFKENNVIDQHRHPLGQFTFTSLFSAINSPVLPENSEIEREMFFGNVFCDKKYVDKINKLSEKLMIYYEKMNILRLNTQNKLDFQIFSLGKQEEIFHIQSGSPPSGLPDEEPSPTPTPEPTPTPQFFAEVPVIKNGDEYYSQIDNEAHFLKDALIVWLEVLEDIRKKNQEIVDLKNESTLPLDQAEVKKSLENIAQSNYLKNNIMELHAEIVAFIPTLDCSVQRYAYLATDVDEWGSKQNNPGAEWSFAPHFKLDILYAQFRPSTSELNRYKKELVVHARIGNISTFHQYYNGEGLRIDGNGVLNDLEILNEARNVPEGAEAYYLQFPTHGFTSTPDVGFITLIFQKFDYTSEFLSSKGILAESTQDSRLFNGIPIRLEVKTTENITLSSNLYIINPLGLEVLDIPENEEVVYLDGAALFSPRDQNVQFDRLAIPLDVPPGSGWNMKLFAQDDLDGEPFWQTSGTGPQQVVWDGFSEENCVPENKYVLRASDSQGNVISEQTLAVDSTPPLVKELDIQVEVKQTEPEEVVETTVKFQIFDPLIKGVAAGLNLDKWQLQIDVDDAPLFATPLRDPDGFWVASALPQNQITVESVDPRTAKVEFKLPYRLDGRMIKVRARDRVGNQVWQLIQSQGGLF